MLCRFVLQEWKGIRGQHGYDGQIRMGFCEVGVLWCVFIDLRQSIGCRNGCWKRKFDGEFSGKRRQERGTVDRLKKIMYLVFGALDR